MRGPAALHFPELSHGVIERAVDCRVDVLVATPVVGTPVHDETAAAELEVDAHAVVTAVLLVAVRRLDRHVARDQPLAEGVESLGA